MFKNKDAVELALAFQPILLFDPSERFYPIAAEEWLDHLATQPWNSPESDERGTAVMVANLNAINFDESDVRAGSHYPKGDHISLTNSAPNGIGQAFTVQPDKQDLFLDVAGWEDATSAVPTDPRFITGSLQYLNLLFRTVSHAMNSTIPLDEPAQSPKFNLRRLSAPTVYAEVEWAGTYPLLDKERVDKTGGSQDFPLGMSIKGTGELTMEVWDTMHDLDNYIAITYYLLYPVMEPAVSSDDLHKREGQWEAITVFLKLRSGTSKLNKSRDGRQRMDFFSDVRDVPSALSWFDARFVAYSRGYDTGDDSDSPLAAEVRPLFGTGNPNLKVQIFNNHPVAYVTAGLHRNLFDIAANVTIGDSPPDPTLNSIGTTIIGLAGILAGICPLATAGGPLAIACWATAGAVFLIGLALFLASFLLKSDPPVTEAPNPSSTEIARDGGGEALPSGTQPVKKPGITYVGSNINSQIRVVDRFGFDPMAPVTTYPLPAPPSLQNPIVEMPTWWNFSGRWGIRVVHRANGQWDSGTRRVDTYGRSRGYWNAYRLVQFISDPQRQNDGISL